MKKKHARWILAEKRNQLLNTFKTRARALLTSQILIFSIGPKKFQACVDFIWILH